MSRRGKTPQGWRVCARIHRDGSVSFFDGRPSTTSTEPREDYRNEKNSSANFFENQSTSHKALYAHGNLKKEHAECRTNVAPTPQNRVPQMSSQTAVWWDALANENSLAMSSNHYPPSEQQRKPSGSSSIELQKSRQHEHSTMSATSSAFHDYLSASLEQSRENHRRVLARSDKILQTSRRRAASLSSVESRRSQWISQRLSGDDEISILSSIASDAAETSAKNLVHTELQGTPLQEDDNFGCANAEDVKSIRYQQGPTSYYSDDLGLDGLQEYHNESLSWTQSSISSADSLSSSSGNMAEKNLTKPSKLPQTQQRSSGVDDNSSSTTSLGSTSRKPGRRLARGHRHARPDRQPESMSFETRSQNKKKKGAKIGKTQTPSKKKYQEVDVDDPLSPFAGKRVGTHFDTVRARGKPVSAALADAKASLAQRNLPGEIKYVEQGHDQYVQSYEHLMGELESQQLDLLHQLNDLDKRLHRLDIQLSPRWLEVRRVTLRHIRQLQADTGPAIELARENYYTSYVSGDGLEEMANEYVAQIMEREVVMNVQNDCLQDLIRACRLQVVKHEKQLAQNYVGRMTASGPQRKNP